MVDGIDGMDGSSGVHFSSLRDTCPITAPALDSKICLNLLRQKLAPIHIKRPWCSGNMNPFQGFALSSILGGRTLLDRSFYKSFPFSFSPSLVQCRCPGPVSIYDRRSNSAVDQVSVQMDFAVAGGDVGLHQLFYLHKPLYQR